MANEQWPLTAAATQILLDTPSVFRGAYRIEITGPAGGDRGGGGG